MEKKYLIFTANYLPNLGGVERYTYNLAKELVRRGNQVTVVTNNVMHLQEHEVSPEGIELFRLPCINLMGGRFPITRAGGWRKLLGTLGERHFDFAIVQTRFYNISALASAFARKAKIPSILIEHATGYCRIGNPVFDFCAKVYEQMITWYIKRKCKNYYGVSLNSCKWLEAFGIHTQKVLYNSVDLEEIESLLAHPPVDYRRELHLSDDSFLVLYAGRLVAEKGILKLVQAVENMQHQGKDVHLLVAGDGDLLPALQEKNLPYMHLLGKVDFPHVVALLKSSDVFCLPTDYPEGFPTSVLEAAACKCYIITTDRGGSKELIQNSDYGTILRENSIGELTAALTYASQHPRECQAAAQTAYNFLKSHFVWTKVADQIITIEESMEHD